VDAGSEMMRQKHANWELDTQSAFVHEVVFAHSRIVCSQFIYFDLLPPCEANLETPRRELRTQISSMMHPMTTTLLKGHRKLTLTLLLMVSENASHPQSREVSVRCSKVANIIGMLTLLNNLDDDANEKRLARLARLEKENKKMKVKLLKASKEAAKSKSISLTLRALTVIYLQTRLASKTVMTRTIALKVKMHPKLTSQLDSRHRYVLLTD
jgi:hypothetical protein